MSTLIADLDARTQKKHGSTILEYFETNNLKWWKKLSKDASYKEQEMMIERWLGALKKRDELRKVLEFGPGFGRITKLIPLKPSTDLTLVERNKFALKYLNRQYPRRRIIIGDAGGFMFPIDGYLDMVIAVEILVHIPDIETMMRNIHRSLKDQGRAIVSITPESWYKENVKKPTATHRGIDVLEFEDFVLPLFSLADLHRSSNGQQLTYLLQKR